MLGAVGRTLSVSISDYARRAEHRVSVSISDVVVLDRLTLTSMHTVLLLMRLNC